MSNKGSQARTRPRRRPEDRRPITAAVLHSILSKEARGGEDLREDDTGLKQMAEAVAELQRNVWNNEILNERWRPQKERNARLAGAIQTVLETLPSLYDELGRSVALASADNNIAAEILFKGASNMVVDLGQAAEAVEGHWLLMDPKTRDTSPVTWEAYAEEIVVLLKSRLPQFSTEASYRLVVALVPDFSGEPPTYSAVKTYLVRRGKKESLSK